MQPSIQPASLQPAVQIRHAVATDLPAIVAIYNAAIPTRNSTADLYPVSVESRREWFANHNPQKRPLWVLTVNQHSDGSDDQQDNQQVVAWLGLSSFYGGRPAYDATAEISIYIAPDHQGKGYGSMLLRQAIEQASQLGITTYLAIYFDHNAASCRLFERFEFQPAGRLPEIASLDGVKRGVVIAMRRV